MTYERFKQTNYKMTYEEFCKCDCSQCSKSDCMHRGAYRRFPEIDGGLGLCPNLIDSKEEVLIMKVTEIKKRFGTVNFEGIEYVLTQDAYFWSACDNRYASSAIREDEIDEDGEPINKYIVFWVLDEYNSSLQDEGDACDWEHPVDVIRC